MAVLKYVELLEESKTKFEQARAILEAGESIGQEEKNKLQPLLEDAKALKARGMQLKEILEAAGDLEKETKGKPGKDAARKGGGDESTAFKSFGDQLTHIANAGNIRYRGELHPSLSYFNDAEEGSSPVANKGKGNTWEKEFGGKKDLGESVGASGGFLVMQEFRAELFAVPAPVDNIRARATVIPMRSRTLTMPRLDQSGTAAGAPHFFGGIQADWTEEATDIDQDDPVFGTVTLTAYKLACYTRAGDELLSDSAVALAAFLSGPMGFAGAIKWQEEYAFLRGSGGGMPQGVIDADCTLAQARVSTVSISPTDVIGMIAKLMGDDGIWHISRSQLSALMQLNGPSGNPSYIFMPSAREGAPSMLFGMPIQWSDKMPAAGSRGDFTLANWKFYLVGDRQATTIDSTNVERFRQGQTSWRAIHRVDGRPWLKSPITYADGTTQVSPFVVLGNKTT